MKLNHFNISLIKSIIRIGGYGLLLKNIIIGVIVLIFSELLGVFEQIVDKRKED